MKKFTKIASLLIAGVMLIGIVGCGSSANLSSEEESAENSIEQETAENPSENLEQEVLTWGTNAEFPPYEYREGDEVVGIDAEIVAAIAEKLGMTSQVEDMNFDSIIAAVQTGKVDMGVAGMTATADRAQMVNFTYSYATATQVIIVKEDSEIKTADDLAGKTIGVQLGTTGDIYASDIEGAEIEKYNKGSEAVVALMQDKVDAVVIDDQPAKNYVAANEGIVILDEPLTTEEYAIAIAKDNTELLEKVNAALKELKESGELQAIIDKYIAAE